MTYAERLNRLAYYTLAGVLVIAAVLAVWRIANPPGIDPRTGSAEILVETDAATGCQYVVTPWGGIVARLDAGGKPLCEGASK